jgi:DNA-binding NarL/FixJ family response regulator
VFVEAWAQGRAMSLEQAIAHAEETKDKLLAATVQQHPRLSAAAQSQPPSPPPSPRRALQQHFGGLTSREREVARLVAQGKSNRAIAEELVVGVSTVEAHITHIFTKLGFSSRAQIAAWAVDKGLAQAAQDWRAPDRKG